MQARAQGGVVTLWTEQLHQYSDDMWHTVQEYSFRLHP